ncbi:MAG: Prepilin-type N-terminal cleavage/methylation protein [Patescibacteria group bacterium]|nr:Prepilin-type N-terminal cleavage/methylation protein [Patescibacteria group bacterium]
MRLKMDTLNGSEAGDTIVEVLIAIMVISSMLVGAFSIVNKSSMQIRASQERTEASRITTSLLEKIKNDSGPFVQDPPNTNWRCDTSGGSVPAGPGSVPTEMTLSSLPVFQSSSDTVAGYNTACGRDNGGVTYITIYSHDPITDVFRIVTRWDRAGGGRDQLEMVYASE